MDTTQDDRGHQARMREIDATIAKLNAETMKILAEAKWYPFVVLAGVVGATAVIVKLWG